MANQNLEKVLPAMRLMEQLESSIANFYEACAETFPFNREFWQGLVEEETEHTEAVRGLMREATENPDMCAMGDSSPLEALESFTARVNTTFEKLRMGHLSEEKALLEAYLIENTFAERKYTEVIRIKDAHRAKMFAKLSSDSVEHRDRVLSKMREGKYKWPAPVLCTTTLE